MTRLSRLHNTAVALSILGLVAAVPGCGGKKKKKSEVRAEKGEAKLKEVMETRRKRLVETLPKSDEGRGQDHPWLEWISKAAGTISKTEFRKVGVVARGTKTADAGKALARWLEAQKKFYWDQKLGPREYFRELTVVSQLSKGKPYEQDVAFDKIFFHAAETARTSDLFGEGRGPEDDRVTRFFTYWLLAYDFKAETSFFQEETNKLCNEKIKGYCDKIPMELRPYQVMKPYYDKIIELTRSFKATYPDSAYNGFVDRIAKVYEDRKSKVPKWVERPVLPGIRSTIGAPVGGNAVLWMLDDGVVLMDNVLRKKGEVPKAASKPTVTDETTGMATAIKGFKMPAAPTQPWQADWKKDPDLEVAIRVLVEDVRSSTVSQFNQSTVLVVAQKNVRVGYIRDALKATIVGQRAKEWPTTMLVGRRREDGSNKRCGYHLTLLAADKAVAFKMKAPGAKKAMTCSAWAVIGRERYEAKGFVPAVYHDGKQVHVGKLGTDGTMRSAQSAPGHGEGDRLDKWAAQQSSSIVVAVGEDATYDQWLEALNGTALKCEAQKNLPPRCKKLRTNPVFVATCR